LYVLGKTGSFSQKMTVLSDISFDSATILLIIAAPASAATQLVNN